MTFRIAQVTLLLAASALASAQEADDREYFPCEPGTRWVYEVEGGGTLEVEATRATDSEPGRVDMVTRGMQRMRGGPDEVRDLLVVGREGVRLLGAEFTRDGNEGSFRGIGSYQLKFPVAKAPKWFGARTAFWEGKWCYSFSAAYEACGVERLVVLGEERECVRISWSLDKTEVAGLTAEGSLWYAKGLGVVKGEMTVRFEKESSTLSWKLKEMKRP